jgi:transcriptional regulator with XRE-family HTH domain
MSKIDKDRLRRLREVRGLSQAALAQKSKVHKQTISRIESGAQGKTRRSLTADRLARGLNVEPGVLTGELPVPDFGVPPPKSRSKISLSVQTDNFLYLVSERYFVKPWQVLELAPLLFCWAAEMSLRARRERLRELKNACEAARALEKEMRHLPDPNFTSSEEKIAAESSSIGAHDIFGTTFGDDAFADGPFYPPSDDTDNPFAMFLAKLADDIGYMATFEGFSPIDYPIYQVCRDEALNLAGGDEELAEKIVAGNAVVLNEMPKELQDTFLKTEERTAWVRAKVDEYINTHIRAAALGKNTKEAST